MKPIIDHIQITVRDMSVAVPFYDRFLPLLGFDMRRRVDRLYSELVEIGAVIVSEPRLYPEYSPGYYAVFFKDIEGIKYEIVCDKHDEA